MTQKPLSACSRLLAGFMFASAPSFAAHAAEECAIRKGLPAEPAAFVENAKICLSGVAGIAFEANSEVELMRLANVAREAAGKPVLSEMESLRAAARLHAMDLAARGYASHVDPEGRGHLERVRLLERQHLIGAFGAVVTIVPAGSSEKDILLALLNDPSNAENLLRREFDRVGTGVAESGGKLFIVQLFANTPSSLASALPVRLSMDSNLPVAPSSARQFKRWQITDRNGVPLLVGRTAQISSAKAVKTGFLSLEFEEDGRTVSLKGPAVQLK